jgi:hypothetical protein
MAPCERLFTPEPKGKSFTAETQNDQERPRFHCMMVDLIDDYFTEYPATSGADAIAKTVAELAVEPQQVVLG